MLDQVKAAGEDMRRIAASAQRLCRVYGCGREVGDCPHIPERSATNAAVLQAYDPPPTECNDNCDCQRCESKRVDPEQEIADQRENENIIRRGW